MKGNSHDVGERISWTLRPVVSTKLNLVVLRGRLQGGLSRRRSRCRRSATRCETSEKVVENEKIVTKTVPRKVKPGSSPGRSGARRMKGACLNCHNDTYVDNFYEQFDELVDALQREVRQARAGADERTARPTGR